MRAPPGRARPGQGETIVSAGASVAPVAAGFDVPAPGDAAGRAIASRGVVQRRVPSIQ